MEANMDGVGELEVAESLSEYGLVTCLTKQHDVKKIKKFKKIKTIYKNIALSIGIKDEDFKRLDDVLKEFSFINFICIDVANGYSEHFSKYLKIVREKYPTKTIIAGNVVTADMAQELVLSGADIVKVGIGPGSVCTTRTQTGVGYPQLSAVIECADAAHGLGAHIIADGGCTCPGDVAKGFGAGADFVMLGGMFAGHDEGGGKIVKSNGSKYIEFYGSSSDTANKKHYGGLSNYRSSEGRTVKIKYRGKVKNTISNILGGVRSSCTYVGAPSLKQLSKCTTFVRVSNQFNDTFIK
jgi:GMP reductase